VFLGAYGVFRFAIEFIRVPDAHIGYLAFGWVTMGQVLSAPMVIAGGILVWLAYRFAAGAETTPPTQPARVKSSRR
jgi:phosphatidylglycerol:prolipoprotein diacylglycerol transferase